METKTPNLQKNKKIQAPRLATIFAWVVGLAGIYISMRVFLEPEETMQRFFGVEENTPNYIAHSWAVRNIALSILLVFAAIKKRPLMLFSAMTARAITDFGDFIITLAGPTDDIQAIPIAMIFLFELFVLLKMRKSLRI